MDLVRAFHSLTGVRRGEKWPTNNEPRMRGDGTDQVFYNADFTSHINSDANHNLLRAVVRKVSDEYKVQLDK